MQIIIQISAWVVLAVSFFALGHKFFPYIKKWFTTGKVSYVWLIAITLGLFVLLTYPYFFNWWAINFWGVPREELSDLTKLGPLGDIYGSLNTLISSIALCAVGYSAYLQVTSLNESRKATERQLLLAEKNHLEQLKESKNAIFSNQFYSLLNFKNNKLNSLTINKTIPLGDTGSENVKITAEEVIEHLSFKFCKILEEDKNCYKGFTRGELFDDFQKVIMESEFKNTSSLVSYFHIYPDLCRLIKDSNIAEHDKNFYKSVLSNSMTIGEQILLFWLTPMFKSFDLTDSEIFSMFGQTKLLKNFALEFHEQSHFKNNEWKRLFSNYENPT
jgi:hypothetical protein